LTFLYVSMNVDLPSLDRLFHSLVMLNCSCQPQVLCFCGLIIQAMYSY